MRSNALSLAAHAHRIVPIALEPWRGAALVTVAYALARLTASAGTAALTGSPWSFDPAAELVAAALVGASLWWLAPRLAGTRSRRTVTLALLLFASITAVMIEGTAFAPTLSPLDRLPIGLALQLGVSVLTSWIAASGRPGPAVSVESAGRNQRSTVVRLIPAALVYVVAYFVTGAINFALVTGPYYQAHTGGLTTPAPLVVLLVALVEGLLLATGAIPLATTLVGSRRGRACAIGGVLWLLGGLVPLVQEASLPDVLRVASALEIAFQKVPLGIAVSWLFAARPVAGVAGNRQLQGGRR